jgi:hypothetical protein
MDTLFTVNISLNYTGMMTLNSLTNDYSSPPIGGNANPPYVASYIAPNATNVTAIEACGLCMSGPYGQYQYNCTAIYNLPDGSILTIQFSLNFQGEVETYSAIVSAGSSAISNSLFEVVNDTLTGSYSGGGYVYQFTVQMQGTSSSS